VNDPLLSGCRVQELVQALVDAGYPASSITIETNGSGCE
jgi:hypothetical protein